jgi:hypothetical protein
LEPVGITLATVLTIELAIFATTPFLALRFFVPVVFDLVFDALLVFGLVVAAFFAIDDSAMRSPLQITLNWKFSASSIPAGSASHSDGSGRLPSYFLETLIDFMIP